MNRSPMPSASSRGSDDDLVAMPPKPAWMPPFAFTVSFFTTVFVTAATPPVLWAGVEATGAAGASGAGDVAGAGVVTGTVVSPTCVGPGEPELSPAKLTGAVASTRAIAVTAR